MRKRRHRVADADHRLEQRHARIRRVQHEVGLGESFEAADEVRVRGLLRDVASPEVSVADAAKQRVLVVALEVLGELGLVRLEIADHADDDRILLRDLEDPQVVLDPRARLDLDRADDAERDRELPIAFRVGCDAWHAGRTGVRRALRAIRVEQVNVRVDDRDRRGLGLSRRRQRSGRYSRGRARQEVSARMSHARCATRRRGATDVSPSARWRSASSPASACCPHPGPSCTVRSGALIGVVLPPAVTLTSWCSP